MCGIVGVFHDAKESTADNNAMGERALDRLAHRGPDDVGLRHVRDTAWLGHRRLSIVDVDSGHQPLGGTRGPSDWVLVCNGEIYNHQGLREEMPEAFDSRSDSAAALAVLRTGGPAALESLRGMFALCAATEDGEFVAARDAVGIKPLYWARTEHGTVFASELKAFDPEVQPLVEVFPPGFWWTPHDGLHRFAEAIPDRVEDQLGTSGDGQHGSDEALEQATFDAVADSVRRHLMADVEVGVFLSGGLDSGLVAAIAADHCARQGRTLKTFAVGTRTSPDLLAARETAEYLGTDHHEELLDEDAAREALPDVVGSIESFDASLVRSAVPNWFLSKMTSHHVKAVLTGEGADELFAGYGYYHEQFASPAELDEELRRTIEGLHGLNLQRCDRVTMAHGLEARVPFLDRDVISHAMSLPARLKGLESDGLEKAHLRRAFRGWLPEHLLFRRKEQFGTGSGAQGFLDRVGHDIDDAEFSAETVAPGAPEIRSKEELAYYRMFRSALPEVRPDAALTRFAVA